MGPISHNMSVLKSGNAEPSREWSERMGPEDLDGHCCVEFRSIYAISGFEEYYSRTGISGGCRFCEQVKVGRRDQINTTGAWRPCSQEWLVELSKQPPLKRLKI